MDNTPRGRDDYNSIWWVDALSQQALSAHYIAKIADVLGDNNTKQRFTAKFEEKKALLQNYWDEDTGAFLDIYRDGSGFCNVLTPASFWPAFAYCATVEQRKRLFSLLDDPCKLGGFVPFPSVSRDDPAFDPKGCYWRGAVWLPTAYMTVKTLEQFEEYGKAAELSLKLLRHMVKTWKEYEPHTIWECYSPTADLPSTCREDVYSRPDLCGWAALGPISLFIENLLGIRDVNTLKGTLVWEPRSNQRSGIENLKMGSNTVTLIADPQNGRATVESSEKFTLKLWGREYIVDQGRNEFPLSEPLA
jgi:glycogen debranching enzyme